MRAAARTRPALRRLDIDVLIRETVALAQRHARAATALLRTNLGAGLPPVIGDPVQVQHVLLSLVVNAVDATASSPDGVREVTISSAQARPDAVRIAVRDTGPGIAPASVSVSLKPFYTTQPHGLGLGLTLSAPLVEQVGGRLRVQPADHGSHMDLSLPARAC